MRVIALLNWYDENPTWLAQCVTSCAKLADAIVAVDGPYTTFPGALKKPHSGLEQAEVIHATATGSGMDCLLHTRQEPWWGGEVEKRHAMLRLGMALGANESDWFLRIDADESLTDVPPGTRELLASTKCDVAEMTFWTRAPHHDIGTVVDMPDAQSQVRTLFRALPGIGVEQAHYVVTAYPEGRRKVLAGKQGVHDLASSEVTGVRVEHRRDERSVYRKRLKAQYGVTVTEYELERVQAFAKG